MRKQSEYEEIEDDTFIPFSPKFGGPAAFDGYSMKPMNPAQNTYWEWDADFGCIEVTQARYRGDLERDTQNEGCYAILLASA